MRKNGFTLIELLAVIVILAIIALIATPIVLSIIDNTKQSSMLRSAEMYLKGVETSVATATLHNKVIKDDKYNILSDGNICLKYNEQNPSVCEEKLEIKMNGEVPSSGTVTIQNGQIKDIELKYENSIIVKNFGGQVIYKIKLNDVCQLADGYTANQIGAKYTCDFGGGNKNFYILELGTNPVSNSTLESDEVALILEGNYDTTIQAWCDQNGANPRNNVCAADGLTSKLDEIATAYTKLEREQIGLPSMEQIMVADGKSEDAYTYGPSLSNAWLYNWPDNADYGSSAPYGYWSSSPFVDFSSSAWNVSYGGSVNFSGVDVGYAVRPVITLKI